MKQQRILVTGASGSVGAEVVHRLAREGHSIVACVHRARTLVIQSGRELEMRRQFSSDEADPGEIQWVNLRLTEPRMGLGESLYAELRDAVDMVVHGAAITDFGRPRDIYQAVNVQGTAELLDFIASAGRRLPLVHISTAYVSGERFGVALETELQVGQRFGNFYEESKFQAEELVCDSGLPAVMVRPSIIVGLEETGQTRDFRHLFPVLKIMTTGRLRTMPGKYGGLLDLVPIDYVADVINACVEDFPRVEGKTLHAVNGQPLSYRQMSDELATFPQFLMPRFVPRANFRETDLPREQKLFYDQLIHLYVTYFNRRVHFDDTLARELMGSRCPDPSAIQFQRLLDYCLQVGYLGSNRIAASALPLQAPVGSAPSSVAPLSMAGAAR